MAVIQQKLMLKLQQWQQKWKKWKDKKSFRMRKEAGLVCLDVWFEGE